LIASVTADVHISKGAFRPYVPQELRAANLAAIEAVDYVIIDTKDRTWPQFLEDFRSATQRLLADPNYGIIASEDGVIVFKRGSPDLDILPYERLTKASPQHGLGVDFSGESIRLLGYDVGRIIDGYGHNLALVSLYWQSTGSVSWDLRARLELSYDKANLVEENWLAWNIYPATTWQPDEVVKETYKIRLPENAPNENCTLSLKLSSWWHTVEPANVGNVNGSFQLGSFDLP